MLSLCHKFSNIVDTRAQVASFVVPICPVTAWLIILTPNFKNLEYIARAASIHIFLYFLDRTYETLTFQKHIT